VQQFSVRQGHVRRGFHKGGEYLLFGPGVHRILSPYVSVESEEIPLSNAYISHGTKTIVTVPQGFVGLATDRGQPVLLPPGLHQWASATMHFEKLIDLSSAVIQLGPFTLITVDQGYSAITQDNGEQKVLPGGQAYMLTHRNWKFEKFITEKLQTNDLGPIRATTGDNVPLETTATVTWQIENPALAARIAANTMNAAGEQATSQAQREDISKLRQDVLKQATASLAAFIGSIRYSEGLHVSAKIARTTSSSCQLSEPELATDEPQASTDRCMGTTAIFDARSIGCAVAHANEVCQNYGIKIISINVISACPSDQRLMEALSAGAVAAAEAEQAETAARGNAKALLISAQSDAEACRIRARGASDAARELQAAGDVAIDIARLEKVGEAFGGSTNVFVADSPASLPAAILAGFAAKKV
jgi:regulator of protease activity HflC (stomatin/prohibitin superfamily)